MRTNCKNCGAPLEAGRIQCAYCGTSYYDLSFMPTRKPFYLTVNVGSEEKPQLITAKVFLQEATIHSEPNTWDLRHCDGRYITRTSWDHCIEMSFYVMEDLK